MYISKNFNGWLQLQKDRLVSEDILRHEAEVNYILLTDLNVLVAISLLGLYANFLVLFKIEISKDINDPICN